MNVKCDEGRIIVLTRTEYGQKVTRSLSSDDVVNEAHGVVGAVHGALHVPPGHGRGLSPGNDEAAPENWFLIKGVSVVLVMSQPRAPALRSREPLLGPERVSVVGDVSS